MADSDSTLGSSCMTHPALRHPGATAPSKTAPDTRLIVTICAPAAKQLLEKQNKNVAFDTAIHADEARHYTARKTQVLLLILNQVIVFDANDEKLVACSNRWGERGGLILATLVHPEKPEGGAARMKKQNCLLTSSSAAASLNFDQLCQP